MKVHRIVAVCALVLSFDARATGQVYEPDPDADAYEFNDDVSASSDLQNRQQWIDYLSIVPANDVDWFQWDAFAAGSVEIRLSEINGPLRIQVWKDIDVVFEEADYTAPVTVSGLAPANKVLIKVTSANGQENPLYTLDIVGSAAWGYDTGTFNRVPAANPDTVTVTEATPLPVDVLANDVDPDMDQLSAYPHSDWFGRARRLTFATARDKIEYVPATSLTGASMFPIDPDTGQPRIHVFTYYADDGKGGRSKAKVTVSINPLTGAPPPAFPEGEGFGAYSSGGRGQPVHVVTNLEDNGDDVNPTVGSLRDALNSGPGIVVFTVGGPIHVNQELRIPSGITIAGETAPADGITIVGNPARHVDEALLRIGDAGQAINNVVVRYVRARDVDRWDPGDLGLTKPGPRQDTLQILDASDVIIDHCSFSWGNDEVLEIYGNCNKVTVQWSIMAEGLETHSMGTMVGYPGVQGNHYVTLHHNLWASNRYRNPLITDNASVDVINNVTYNWGTPPPDSYGITIGYGNTTGLPPGSYGGSRVNVVKNYVIAGPNSSTSPPYPANSQNPPANISQGINVVLNLVHWGRPDVTTNNNNKQDVDYPDTNHNNGTVPLVHTAYGGTEWFTRFDWTGGPPFVAVSETEAQAAYDDVMAHAGASRVRDDTDDRIIGEVSARSGSLKPAPPSGEVPVP
jgi:pectate lyase